MLPVCGFARTGDWRIGMQMKTSVAWRHLKGRRAGAMGMPENRYFFFKMTSPRLNMGP